MARVTGIGGVFFKAKGDNQKLAEWYKTHLGFSLEDFGGAILDWQEDKADDKGITVWSVAQHDTEWFGPSSSSFMINYRVDNLMEMIADMKANGVEVVKDIEFHENGKFAWVMDPDGNKVELWEPKLWDEKNKQ